MRSKLPSAVLLSSLAVATSLAGESASPPAARKSPYASISGQLAFSDAIVFDYDRNGTPNRVQFWIDLEGTPIEGGAVDPDTSPVAGSVSYFVMDLDSKRRIDNWLLAFNMGEGFPVAGQPYPITNLRITERTAQFDLSGSSWTIIDRGDRWDKDTIEIETGGRKRVGRFYGGDVTVTPGPAIPAKPATVAASAGPPPAPVASAEAEAAPEPAATEAAAGPPAVQVPSPAPQAAPAPSAVTKPVDIAANRRCNRCHEEAAVSMAADGGPHSKLKCSACHTEHPKENPGAVPQCLKCHDAHVATMKAESCSQCHSSHAVQTVRYGIRIPDEYCTTCHEKSASQLLVSGTRHVGLACSICHMSDHGAIPTCTHCHGGPHAKRVMSKPDRCVQCHNSAHATETDR